MPTPSASTSASTASATRTVAIRLCDVSKAFGSKQVLDGTDLDIYEGESLVIIGGSGTGKSVLLKHMIGLLQPDSGTVEVDGVDLAGLSGPKLTAFRRRFGMAFQEGALFDSMSVHDNIAFPLRRMGSLRRAEIEARVEECLRLVRLSGAGGKMPSELSGGMRRRIGFARAIALEPRILLFDEPTTGLDPVMKANLDNVILDLRATLQPTTVTISHDLPSAFRIGDRIAMLHRGKIIAAATPNELQASDDPRVRQFLEGRADGPLSEEAAIDEAG